MKRARESDAEFVIDKEREDECMTAHIEKVHAFA